MHLFVPTVPNTFVLIQKDEYAMSHVWERIELFCVTHDKSQNP